MLLQPLSCVQCQVPSLRCGTASCRSMSYRTVHQSCVFVFVLVHRYNEMQWYDWNDPRFSTATGHFTQVVWRATNALGCAVQVCPDGVTNTPFTAGTLVVCRYSPPGNIVGDGQFERNVLPIPMPGPVSPPPTSPPPSPPAPVPAATLPAGHDFVSPGCLVSVGDVVWLCMQNDGNVVLYRDKQPIW